MIHDFVSVFAHCTENGGTRAKTPTYGDPTVMFWAPAYSFVVFKVHSPDVSASVTFTPEGFSLFSIVADAIHFV